MTIVVAALTRAFNYSGLKLADPDTSMTPQEVRDFYSASFGELTTAEVHDEGVVDGVHTYSFQRIAGTKG